MTTTATTIETRFFTVDHVDLGRMKAEVVLVSGQWLKDDPSGETEKMAGEEFPVQVECDPADPHAEWFEDGERKLTLPLPADTPLRPGDYVRVDVSVLDRS